MLRSDACDAHVPRGPLAMDALPQLDPVIRVTAMSADANDYGDIFGGWLLSLLDMGAGWTRRGACTGAR